MIVRNLFVGDADADDSFVDVENYEDSRIELRAHNLVRIQMP